MSYILDALKKADAERARDRSAVPGLDAQPEAALGGRELRHAGALPWRAIAVAVAVLVGALLAWLAWSPRDEPVVAAAPIAATPVPTPAAAPVAPMDATPAVAPAPGASTAAATVTSAASMPAAAATATTAAVAPAAPPPARPVHLPAAARTSQPVAASPAAKASAAAADTATSLPTLAQLPAQVRSALPPLSVSGAVYAPQPGGRMVFLNGQVLREGAAVADGLTVEHIGPDATVLSFRGTRFQLRH